MVDLFIGGVRTDVEEMVGCDVFSVDLTGVISVVDHVGNHDLDVGFRVLVVVELSDVKGSVVVLSLDIVEGLFDVDSIAGGVGAHIDYYSLLRRNTDYLL